MREYLLKFSSACLNQDADGCIYFGVIEAKTEIARLAAEVGKDVQNLPVPVVGGFWLEVDDEGQALERIRQNVVAQLDQRWICKTLDDEILTVPSSLDGRITLDVMDDPTTALTTLRDENGKEIEHLYTLRVHVNGGSTRRGQVPTDPPHVHYLCGFKPLVKIPSESLSVKQMLKDAVVAAVEDAAADSPDQSATLRAAWTAVFDRVDGMLCVGERVTVQGEVWPLTVRKLHEDDDPQTFEVEGRRGDRFQFGWVRKKLDRDVDRKLRSIDVNDAKVKVDKRGRVEQGCLKLVKTMCENVVAEQWSNLGAEVHMLSERLRNANEVNVASTWEWKNYYQEPGEDKPVAYYIRTEHGSDKKVENVKMDSEAIEGRKDSIRRKDERALRFDAVRKAAEDEAEEVKKGAREAEMRARLAELSEMVRRELYNLMDGYGNSDLTLQNNCFLVDDVRSVFKDHMDNLFLPEISYELDGEITRDQLQECIDSAVDTLSQFRENWTDADKNYVVWYYECAFERRGEGSHYFTKLLKGAAAAAAAAAADSDSEDEETDSDSDGDGDGDGDGDSDSDSEDEDEETDGDSDSDGDVDSEREAEEIKAVLERCAAICQPVEGNDSDQLRLERLTALAAALRLSHNYVSARLMVHDLAERLVGEAEVGLELASQRLHPPATQPALEVGAA
eukprot:CAMPEP_0182565142 /NCGR_PEP_ID=MMETSP1324-20130603/6919_1 /TAXON_ID=236786 /ORGANISM="Florenciella sp., Strain RCC1587" /LENGTH=675 /DNA_ID=CAMNT_0024778743 /DNA_START=51 /DNA_END=2077 /DNA_ORIENTATION=+